jgi:predicted lipoprotein with Yx(FWY)xxD motif
MGKPGKRRWRTLPLAVACGAALTVAAGCSAPAAGSAGGNAPDLAQAKNGTRITVDARGLPGVGTVLVTDKDYALYMFQPDNHRAVTCTGACAGTWPPLMLPDGATLVAGPGVKQSLLSSAPDPAGGRVVTYAGWPLYGYTGDTGPDQATGEDIDLNGGEWYVMRVSGQPLEPAL